MNFIYHKVNYCSLIYFQIDIAHFIELKLNMVAFILEQLIFSII